ncbi:hypothetical protein GCM10023172_06350 [Hymenobacter ginsengisoli]|uniref:Uncharacterized protein n=1 Tax=Hymenobacter ginsengisoli TaxID=1051626 RepID=A0ABP8Q2D9_9BACT|nr:MULTISPECIES: hypothetical protein [unclassified Hymenobacter]MBO2032717.1 hypothetical protein [Hymenobacter sp. BT559]
MKTNLLARLVLAGAISCAAKAAAQQPLPAAASGGYWNLETNLTTRNYTLVRFYNAQDQLVYEERLDNLCLDLSNSRPICRRLKQQLDLALQQVLAHPGPATPPPTMLAQQLSTSRRLQRVYRTPDPQRTLAAVR